MQNVEQQRSIQRAMWAPDDLVLQLEYIDSKGNKSVRIVSPIRFLSSGRFLALCLCRCEPRQFHLDRCSQIELKPAADYVMPVAMSQAS
jgi:predicted DNA-binding transcriptional regulator YafY